jgi:nucleotide-binding universal stress UspA family protein
MKEGIMGALQTPPPTKTRISIKNILFATDFSEFSMTAVPFVVAFAKRYGATVLVTHVLPEEAHLPVAVESLPTEQDLDRRLARQEMARLEHAGVFAGVLHEPIIERGEFDIVIDDLVARRKVDLIVAGTHGREGLRKMFLGSVAEEIFRNATCPVLTVGPHVSPDVLADGRFHRVLFATDFSAGSMHALPYALSLAEEDHAQLTLLHAVHLDTATPIEGVRPVYEEQIAARAEAQLRQMIPDNAHLWAEPEILVRSGLPADVIVTTAEEEQASIIIMGVHHARASATHNPWAVAHQVVCHAHCPVLSVRG